jgi:hypothetical protein
LLKQKRLMDRKNNVVSVGPEIFTDRALLSALPDNIAEEIRLRELISNGKVEKVSFVGILILDNRSYVFLPRSTKFDVQEQQLALASNMLKAVEKYGRESETRVDINDEGDGRKNLNQLSLIRSLLDDFRRNGIYTRCREVRKLNQGKTDWKRTVNQIIPFPGKNGQTVYVDTHGIKRQNFNNSEIAVIHANIIHQLDMRFSWIVTGDLQPIAPELRDYSRPAGNIEYQISKLKSELTQIYSDRDIRLLKLLISYLQADSGRDSSNFIAGLEKFHFCWEHMLGKVLKYTVDLNKKLPAPAYIDKNNKELIANEKGMRTDIILLNKETNRCTVADAKYYAATGTGNAPGWSDIVKQLFYEKALDKLCLGATIKNAFIFPGKKGNLKEVRIRDRVNSTKEKSVYIDDFKPVHCYYIEPEKVMEHYLYGNKMEELTERLLNEEAAPVSVSTAYF